MPRFHLLCAIAACAWFVSIAPAAAQSGGKRTAEADHQTTGFAVVELFTSQGCSSCPPADRVLQRVADAAEQNQAPVYALSMHVDYWNSLGWADPYSAEVFTNRQRQYARAASSRRVYTPQMIVNGDAVGFNGSNGPAAAQAIRRGLGEAPAVRVAIEVEAASEPNTWKVAYDAQGAGRGDHLVACLVADAAPNEVPRGENTGRELSHAGVVRALKHQPITSDSGVIELAWPESQSTSDSPTSVVAFVQNAGTMQIRAATRQSTK